MGEYTPDDQRDVHSSETAEWRETSSSNSNSASRRMAMRQWAWQCA